MVSHRILECSFLIPVQRDEETSDGDVHSTKAWNWLESELYERFGGFTKEQELLVGVWKSPAGQRISDNSKKFVVAIDEFHIDAIRELLVEACIVFQQQVIYLSIAGQVEFIEAPKNV